MITSITGDEPYYPTPIAKGNDEITYSRDTGITIRQKFIADFTIKYWNILNVDNEAERAFQAYLKIINGKQS